MCTNVHACKYGDMYKCRHWGMGHKFSYTNSLNEVRIVKYKIWSKLGVTKSERHDNPILVTPYQYIISLSRMTICLK